MSGASGERPQPRALGKRPSGKWTKLGSDADSPPGKRAKTQVPGVKAANGQCDCACPLLYINPMHPLSVECRNMSMSRNLSLGHCVIRTLGTNDFIDVHCSIFLYPV